MSIVGVVAVMFIACQRCFAFSFLFYFIYLFFFFFLNFSDIVCGEGSVAVRLPGAGVPFVCQQQG
jgi:hypothetical protein